MIPLQHPGAHPDPIDYRDFDYAKFAEVFGAPAVDWNTGYEVPNSIGIKVEDQDGSSSCVGQSWAKYSEILEKAENEIFTDHSAKYIYSQIFIVPNGGAYIRDGAKIVVNQGVGLEAELPSYPATEDDMRRIADITEEIKQNAKTYKAKSYASIWHKNNIDTFAQAIQQNQGVVTGVYGTNDKWGEAFVKPPTGAEEPSKIWGHAFYCIGYKIINGQKYIKFINSWGEDWGENGYGYLGEDYFQTGNIFSAWTLVDMPNPEPVQPEPSPDPQPITPEDLAMMKLIKASDFASEIFAVSGNKRFWIMEPDTLNAGIGSAWDAWDKVVVEDPKQYEYGGAFIIVKPDDPIK